MFLGGLSGAASGAAAKKMLMELEFATRGDADVKKAEKGLDTLTGKMFKMTQQSRMGQRVLQTFGIRTLPQFRSALIGAGVAAGITAGAIAGVTVAATKLTASIIETGSQTETYALQFETLMGSTFAAREQLEYLYDFAAATPFQLPEIIEASVLMEAYQINTKDYLEVLGDTAAGMGKTLDQAVNALADASTGELERLKEFGITSALLTQRMGHKINRETAAGITELVDTVIEIWEERYGGGMEKLSRTMTGQISMVKDKIFQFKNDVATAGIFDLIKGDLTSFVGLMDAAFDSGQAEEWAVRLSMGLESAYNKVKALADIIMDLMTLQYVAAEAGRAAERRMEAPFEQFEQYARGATREEREAERQRKREEADRKHEEALGRIIKRGAERGDQMAQLLLTMREIRAEYEKQHDLQERLQTVTTDISDDQIRIQMLRKKITGEITQAEFDRFVVLQDSIKEAQKAAAEEERIAAAAREAAAAKGAMVDFQRQYLAELEARGDPAKQRGIGREFEITPRWEGIIETYERVEQGEMDLQERLMGHRWDAWYEEQHLLEMKLAFYTDMWDQMFVGGKYLAAGLLGAFSGMYQGMERYGKLFAKGDLSMKKTLLLASKYAAQEALAASLDALAEEAQMKAKFYAAEALGLAAAFQFGAAAKAAAAAAAFAALGGLAAGGAAAARERAEEEYERELETTRGTETYGTEEGYAGTRAGGGSMTVTHAARPMNLTIVTNLNFIGGLNWFGNEAERDLAELLLPYINEAARNGQLVLQEG